MDTSEVYCGLVEAWRRYRNSGRQDAPEIYAMVNGQQAAILGINTPGKRVGIPFALQPGNEEPMGLTMILPNLLNFWVDYNGYGVSGSPFSTAYVWGVGWYEITEVTLDSDNRIRIQTGKLQVPI